ncbi:MAG: kelch repeat-containing protein [Nitrospira sp.]|nr:kelch repeat-containing protein [Nitrospira sp.]
MNKARMHTARSHSAVAAYKGRIYVFGGGGPDFRSLNSTEIYDPINDTWHEGKDMPTIRSGAVAEVLNDRIHVIGGGFKHPDGLFEFFSINEIYDPETDTWSKGPDMLMPHDYPASVVLNNRIYVLGGHHPEATKGGPMTDPGFSFCEVFDPEEGVWTEIAAMPTPRFAFSAVVLNNKILAIGGAGLRNDGFKNFDIVESYDPSADEWTNAGFTSPWPAAGLGSGVYKGRVYIAGGKSDIRIEDRFTYFEPDSDTWFELPRLLSVRIVMGVVIIGNTFYLIGGRGPDGKTPVATVEAIEI